MGTTTGVTPCAWQAGLKYFLEGKGKLKRLGAAVNDGF
jgi:hypothetical protein